MDGHNEINGPGESRSPSSFGGTVTRDRSKDPPKSAAELMAELQQDPEYIARMREQHRQRRASVESSAQAAAPLLRDLAAIGFHLDAVGDLRRSRTEYRSAVSTLLHWLPRILDLNVKEDIVRTLSVPWAKPDAAWGLIEEFEAADGPAHEGLRSAIANGLAVVADDTVFEELVRLVQDTRYGRAREMLALALGNMENPRAATVLLELLDHERDEQVVGHAVMALGKLKAPDARGRLEELTRHPNLWVCEEARKALARIEFTRRL